MINNMNKNTADPAENTISLTKEGIIRHDLAGPQTKQGIADLREKTLPIITDLRHRSKRVLLLLDLRRVLTTSSEVRNESKKILEADFDAMAIVGNRYLTPIISYVLRSRHLDHKVRCFNNEKAATDWLENPQRALQKRFKDKLAGVPFSTWVVLGVLLLTGHSTATSFNQALERRDTQAKSHFDAEVTRVYTTLSERLQAYENALHSVRGFFHASQVVDEKEYDTFFKNLDLQKKYPGFNSVDFIRFVPKKDLPAFLKEIRTDTSLNPAGHPQFTVSSAGDRSYYYIVTYSGVQDVALPPGTDFAAIDARRPVLEAARDSGNVTASSTVTVRSGNDLTTARGFLLVLPVYDDAVPAAPEARREQLVGFVSAIFNYDIFLQDVFKTAPANLKIDLYDTGDSQREGFYTKEAETAVDGGFEVEREIMVGGRPWILAAKASAEFGLTRPELTQPRTVAFYGILISVLLGVMAWILSRARARAMKLAEVINQDLQSERDMAVETKNKDEAILSSIGDGVFALDTNNSIILFNKAAQQLSGFGAEEVLGRPYKEILQFKSEDGKTIKDGFIAKAQAGNVAQMERGTLLLRKDGSVLPVADSASPIQGADGKPLGIIVVFRDISQEQKAQRLIEESNERFQLASRATSDVIYDLNLVTGHLGWNEALYAVYGYPKAEKADKLEWWTDHIHPDDAMMLNKTLDKLADKNITHWTVEYRFRKADGNYVTVRDRAFVLRSEKGEPQRLIGSMLDITQQKQLEKTKDEFISIISHQLRTPLTAIRLFIEMLAKGEVGKLKPEQQGYVDKVQASTARMIRLVGDILNVSRVELGRIKVNPSLLDANKIIQSHIDEMQPLAEQKRVKLVFKPTKLSPVMLDQTVFDQVVHNLITNAIRYTKSGEGVVALAFTQEADGGYLLSVKDNGIGIPPSARPRIFERFYRADNARIVEGEGTGLGLYLIKIIMETVGGRVWFDTEENKGTTFYAQLPPAGMKRREGERSLS